SSAGPRARPACGVRTDPIPPPAGSPPPSRPPLAARIVLRAGAPQTFFEQPILQHRLGQRLLEPRILLPQPLHLRRRRFTRRVPEPPLLPGSEEFLAPAVVQVGREPLAATQLRHALLAPQPLQDNAHLLLGGEPSPRPPVDLPHDLLGPRSLAHPT